MDVNMEDKEIVVLMRRLAGEEQAPAGYPVQRLHALVGNVYRTYYGFRELEDVARFCLWWLAETGVEDPARAACSAGAWMRDSYNLGHLADQSAGVLADRAFNLLVGLSGDVAQAAYSEPGQVLPHEGAPVRVDAASDWSLVQETVAAALVRRVVAAARGPRPRGGGHRRARYGGDRPGRARGEGDRRPPREQDRHSRPRDQAHYL